MKIKQQLAKRLATLKRIALWEGKLSRSRLMKIHDLSGIRASQWMREFRDLNSNTLEWDNKSKSYLFTEDAYEKANLELEENDSNDLGLNVYLYETSTTPTLAQENDFIFSADWNFSRVKPYFFSRIRMAIEQKRRLEIKYCSMRNPTPHPRNIEPHSLVKAGRRWHLRAFCIETQDFRDFVLGRITTIQLLDAVCQTGKEADTKWNTDIELKIEAHPDLNMAQKKLMAYEYFLGKSYKLQKCKAALMPYFIQEMQLATNPQQQKPPEFQLWLANADQLKEWFFNS
jgi:hypothetical protein